MFDLIKAHLGEAGVSGDRQSLTLGAFCVGRMQCRCRATHESTDQARTRRVSGLTQAVPECNLMHTSLRDEVWESGWSEKGGV